MNDEITPEQLAEAEQYKLQSEFILHQLQANVQVYGTNSAWSGAQSADLDLALKYINRSLEYIPDNPAYLNLKALLLIEGGIDPAEGIRLLERAAELAPRDITIQNNLEKLKAAQSSGCFIATAAFGSDQAWQVDVLRVWRDRSLSSSLIGRWFVRSYYRLSPPIATWLTTKPRSRAAVRRVLSGIVRLIN